MEFRHWHAMSRNTNKTSQTFISRLGYSFDDSIWRKSCCPIRFFMQGMDLNHVHLIDMQ